jgi:hypothetical protein
MTAAILPASIVALPAAVVLLAAAVLPAAAAHLTAASVQASVAAMPANAILPVSVGAHSYLHLLSVDATAVGLPLHCRLLLYC